MPDGGGGKQEFFPAEEESSGMEVHKEEPGTLGMMKWRQVLTDCPYLFSIFNFPFPQTRVKLWGK